MFLPQYKQLFWSNNSKLEKRSYPTHDSYQIKTHVLIPTLQLIHVLYSIDRVRHIK